MKQGKIVLLIDAKKRRVAYFKKLLRELGYEGRVEAQADSDKAVDFLNNVVNEDGQVVGVGLIFCVYHEYQDSALKIFEQLTLPRSAQVVRARYRALLQ